MTANTLLNSQEVRKLPAGALFKAIFVISYISQKSDKKRQTILRRDRD